MKALVAQRIVVLVALLTTEWVDLPTTVLAVLVTEV